MIHKLALVSIVVAVTGLPLFGDENLKPPAETLSTQHADFDPGGTIRITGSYHDLYIEGWDQPRVELTVRKFMPFDYDPENASKTLESVDVSLQSKSPSEMAVVTLLPPRKGLVARLDPFLRTNHVRAEYHLHVPKNSKLVIQHEVGLVSVEGVSGDIDASCHRGDILVWLPNSGIYEIDAKSKLGTVYSDFGGAFLSHFMMGQTYNSRKPEASQRLRLRVGYGGITLKPTLPESQAGAGN